MDCKECRGKIQIKRSYNKIENDNTPDNTDTSLHSTGIGLYE